MKIFSTGWNNKIKEKKMGTLDAAYKEAQEKVKEAPKEVVEETTDEETTEEDK